MAPAIAVHAVEVADDRQNIVAGDRVLLIIEDDPTFARILCDLAHDKDLKVLVALRGDRGLSLAQELQPDAITLDIRLPDTGGWVVLDRLKNDPRTRHIPVHVISIDVDRRRGLSLGAKTYLEKSIDKQALIDVFEKIRNTIERKERSLLVVEHDENDRRRLAELIEAPDVQTTFVGTGAEALQAVREKPFDCIVIDLKQPDMNAFDFISRLQSHPGGRELPVIVYTGDDLSAEDGQRMKELAKTALVRGVRSAERLLEETALFLHRVESNLPEGQRRLLEQARQSKDKWIAGGSALIVDDDVRNIFAITSLLERHKLNVLHAESGRQALDLLKAAPPLDIILMDIMMPEMDGYEAIRAIRQMPEYRVVPIVALTAKAMKGDRDKCIEAGASDYITKPVNLEDLIWTLRAWLPRVAEQAS
jgi:CheY-like chemotaxis protein